METSSLPGPLRPNLRSSLTYAQAARPEAIEPIQAVDLQTREKAPSITTTSSAPKSICQAFDAPSYANVASIPRPKSSSSKEGAPSKPQGGRAWKTLKTQKVKKQGAENTASAWRNAIFDGISTQELERVYQEISSQGFLKDAFLCERLVGAFCEVGNPTRAQELLSEMENNGTPVSALAYSTVIKGFSDVREHERSWQAFIAFQRHKLPADIMPYQSAVLGQAACDQPGRAWDALLSMEKAGLTVGLHLYNMLLDGFRRAREAGQARRVFDAMQAKGYLGDKTTFHCLATIASLTRDRDFGWRVFNALESKGIVCEAETFERLLDVLMDGQDADQTWQVFAYARRNGIPIEQRHVGRAVNYFGTHGDLDKQWLAFHSLDDSGESVSDVYVQLLDAFEKSYDATRFQQLMARIRESKVTLDISAYNRAIESHRRANRLDAVCMIHETLVATDVIGTSYTYSTLMDSFLENDKPAQAYSVFSRMRSAQIACHRDTYFNLLSALDRLSDPLI